MKLQKVWWRHFNDNVNLFSIDLDASTRDNKSKDISTMYPKGALSWVQTHNVFMNPLKYLSKFGDIFIPLYNFS